MTRPSDGPWSRRDLLAYLETIERASSELDHFDLLDVSQDAGDAEIQEAFHRIAGGIHPDRHRRALSVEQRERLTVVYARIAEAYRVLRDPEARRDYLAKMAQRGGRPRLHDMQHFLRPHAASRQGSGLGRRDTADPLAVLSPKAQRFYRRAMVALRTGDRTSALLNLKMALRLHPTSELLREALRGVKP